GVPPAHRRSCLSSVAANPSSVGLGPVGWAGAGRSQARVMTDLTITLLILAAAVAAFISNRIPPGIVALGVALSLWATGVLPLETVFAGFGSTTVVLIASLFVVAEGLD